MCFLHAQLLARGIAFLRTPWTVRDREDRDPAGGGGGRGGSMERNCNRSRADPRCCSVSSLPARSPTRCSGAVSCSRMALGRSEAAAHPRRARETSLTLVMNNHVVQRRRRRRGRVLFEWYKMGIRRRRWHSSSVRGSSLCFLMMFLACGVSGTTDAADVADDDAGLPDK